MQMPWPEFEAVVEPSILERGRQYWRRGRVQELEQSGDNTWSALVEGSEAYETAIILEEGAVVSYECDCPYDLGPVCKHIVALLYAVREALSLNSKEGPPRPSAAGSDRQRRASSVSAQVRSVIQALTAEELSDLLIRYAKKDTVFRAFLLSHAPAADATDKEQYRRLIRLSLQAGMNRDGFIDYRGGSRAVEGVDELIDQAQEHLGPNPATTIAICQAAIEELIPALQYADDSNGEIGGSIENAAELLERVPEYLQDPSLRRELFNYCFTESVHERQQGWDWKWNLLRTAGELIDLDQDQTRLFDHLDGLVKGRTTDSFMRRYDEERVAEIKTEVIRRRQGQTQASNFVAGNLQHPALRRQALAEAASAHDVAAIKRLAQAGLEADQTYLGLTAEWLDWLLRAAELENNPGEVRRYAQELLFATGDLKYYDTLKQNHDSAGWPAQYAQLLNEIQASQSRANSLDTLIGICRREASWEGIYHLIRPHSSMRILMHYHDDLSKHDHEALATLYQQAIRRELKTATNRDHYREICRALRHLRKLGASSRVAEFIDELKAQYPKRPALLEELENV